MSQGFRGRQCASCNVGYFRFLANCLLCPGKEGAARSTPAIDSRLSLPQGSHCLRVAALGRYVGMSVCWMVFAERSKLDSNRAIAYADKNSAANIGALVYTVRVRSFDAKRASSLEMPSKERSCFASQIGAVVVVWYVFNRLLCDRFDLMDAYDPSPLSDCPLTER